MNSYISGLDYAYSSPEKKPFWHFHKLKVKIIYGGVIYRACSTCDYRQANLENVRGVRGIIDYGWVRTGEWTKAPPLPRSLSGVPKTEGANMVELPKTICGKRVRLSDYMTTTKALTIREVREYLNSIPDELIDKETAVSDGTATGNLTSVGFYTNGELYFRGNI